MKKLIEKHQQKNKGRGKITTVDTDSGRTMFFSYDTPTRNKPVQTTRRSSMKRGGRLIKKHK